LICFKIGSSSKWERNSSGIIYFLLIVVAGEVKDLLKAF